MYHNICSLIYLHNTFILQASHTYTTTSLCMVSELNQSFCLFLCIATYFDCTLGMTGIVFILFLHLMFLSERPAFHCHHHHLQKILFSVDKKFQSFTIFFAKDVSEQITICVLKFPNFFIFFITQKCFPIIFVFILQCNNV